MQNKYHLERLNNKFYVRKASTTHCKGNTQTAIDYLAKYLSADDLRLLQNIKATDWNTLKTEAIDFTLDFYWIDDYAMNAEKEILQIKRKQDFLILANAYEDDILDIMKRLFH